jgi:hypothetical protein
LQDGTPVKSLIGTTATGIGQLEMRGHHLGIVMLRIFADVAHVWQRAIGTRFVEEYLTKTSGGTLMRPYRRVAQAAYKFHGADGLKLQQRNARLSLL